MAYPLASLQGYPLAGFSFSGTAPLFAGFRQGNDRRWLQAVKKIF